MPLIIDQKHIDSAWELIKEQGGFKSYFEKLSEEHKIFVGILANEAWFMDYWLAPRTVMARLIIQKKNNTNSLDSFMCEYFDSKIKKIKENICKKYPNRSKIIKAAFKAHKRKEYELSIPIFLSQSEGICIEITGEKLFQQYNKRMKTESWINSNVTNKFIKAYLEPFCTPSAIVASKQEKDKYQGIMNRHLILHGIDTDYATKVNSLKAISLLNYVGTFLYEAKKDTHETNK